MANNCGCRIVTEDGKARIKYCPIHAAAEALLEHLYWLLHGIAIRNQKFLLKEQGEFPEEIYQKALAHARQVAKRLRRFRPPSKEPPWRKLQD